MKKKLLVIGTMLSALVLTSCIPGGSLEPDPLALTGGFAEFVANVSDGVDKYRMVLTSGAGTSIDDITGPGDILMLEILTESIPSTGYFIAPGVYNAGISAAAGTVVLSVDSQFGKIGASGDMELHRINSGNMTISENNSVYTISGKFNSAGGGSFDFNYSGELIFPDKPNMQNIDVLYIGLSGGSNHNHYVVKLSSDDYNELAGTGQMVSLYLDGHKTYFYDGINPDTYAYSETTSGVTFHESKLMKSDDSWFFVAGKNSGNEVAIAGGEVAVAKDGDIFTFTGVVRGAGGEEFEFQYEGPMPMKKAKLHLDHGKGLYYGNYFWNMDIDGDEMGYPDVGMYDITLSNLEFEGLDLYFNGPGESLSFVFGSTFEDNGTLDPVNYPQSFVPTGEYVYDGSNAPGSYAANVIWPFTGEWWNEIHFITVWSDLSKNKMADSRFDVISVEETAGGYRHVIAGNVTTTNGVEIEFDFDGVLDFIPIGPTMRPMSPLTSNYTVKPITKAYFDDWGEEDDGLYYGELWFGSASADPQGLDTNGGDIVYLSMWRDDETDLLPPGTNHFSIARYDAYTPMTICYPIFDEIWESSWLFSEAGSTYREIPVFGIEEFNISKAGNTYTINFIFLDDALPANRVIGSYTGEVLDYWDDEPIDAPRNYVEKRTGRKQKVKTNLSRSSKRQ